MSITLNSAQTATLSSLSETNALFNQTQSELNSGKKVNSASDDAVAYFQSQSLYNRSNNFTNRNTQTNQSIQTLNAALSATSSVATLLSQLKAVIVGAAGASLSSRTSATAQFKTIGAQLAQLVKDASYQGVNLLAGSAASLTTQFSERTAATLKVTGYNLIGTAATKNTLFTGVAAFSSSGKITFSAVVGSVTGFSQLDTVGTGVAGGLHGTAAANVFLKAENRLDAAISQNQAITSGIGTNVSVLQARSSFAQSYSAVLSAGGDKLTLADLNSEAAISSALSLRQQIGIQSLSVQNTQNQSVLSLLR